MKFKIGDKVVVRDDLKVSKKYHNEDSNIGYNFSEGMRKSLGKEAIIVDIINNGYILDINTMHKYSDGMLELAVYSLKFMVDELASKPYTFNFEVEEFLQQSLKEYYHRQIDKALDERLFETDPEGFQKLFDNYKIYA